MLDIWGSARHGDIKAASRLYCTRSKRACHKRLTGQEHRIVQVSKALKCACGVGRRASEGESRRKRANEGAKPQPPFCPQRMVAEKASKLASRTGQRAERYATLKKSLPLGKGKRVRLCASQRREIEPKSETAEHMRKRGEDCKPTRISDPCDILLPTLGKMADSPRQSGNLAGTSPTTKVACFALSLQSAKAKRQREWDLTSPSYFRADV
ncbi:hypothetical protein IWX48DRAFT_426376 [Phyllosticta citricarpa]